MCLDPVSLGAAALSGIGSMISGAEQARSDRAVVEARNKATEDEIARQQGYQQEAGGVFDGLLSQFGPSRTDNLVENQTRAAEFFNSNTPQNFGGPIGAAGAPRQTGEAYDSALGGVFDRAAQRGTALGNLTGYGQQNFDTGLDISDAGRRIGTVQDLSRGSAGLVDLDRTVAGNNAYRPPSGLGDLFSFGGNLLGFKAGEGTLPGIFSKAAKAPMFNPRTAAQGAIY